MKNSNFIRDLLVKLLLIVIFIFLLMYLFPMPNLSPFYSAVFNNNIQTMKNAAKDYYTTDRMPQEVGKSDKMTLQEMIDKKLILPFVDKDGNNCDTKKSYVKVTKLETEYELKVSLTCGKESNYIIEKIGCYNFCKDNACQVKEEDKKPVTTAIDPDGYITVVVPTGKYVTEYEYVRTNTNETWTLGDFRDTKLAETLDVKLAETRIQYTGQKKVETGEKLYEQISYGYKDNWTYDKDWTTEVKTVSDILKLWQERTLYTGQKKVTTGTTEYEHVKYKTTESWKETGYSTTKKTENKDTILIGTRYTVKKNIETPTTTCNGYTTDTNWYTSKPADTSSRKYASTPVNTKTEYGSWKVINDSFKSRTTYSTYEGNLWYEFLYSNDETCTSACNGKSKVRYYYYRVHEGTPVTKYQYQYCVPKATTTTKVDEKVVTDLNSYISKGYTLVKTEYNYKVRTYGKAVEDTKWTNSKTSPAGYEYTGNTRTSTTVKYESLNKWVTGKDKLGEYTYNIKETKQYKYAHNTKEKYVKDTIWTTDKVARDGYELTGNEKTATKASYIDLGYYVNSKAELKEYTYNIQTRTQYRYKFRKVTTSREVKWALSNPGDGFEPTGNSRKTYISTGTKTVTTKKTK